MNGGRIWFLPWSHNLSMEIQEKRKAHRSWTVMSGKKTLVQPATSKIWSPCGTCQKLLIWRAGRLPASSPSATSCSSWLEAAERYLLVWMMQVIACSDPAIRLSLQLKSEKDPYLSQTFKPARPAIPTITFSTSPLRSRVLSQVQTLISFPSRKMWQTWNGLLHWNAPRPIT